MTERTPPPITATPTSPPVAPTSPPTGPTEHELPVDPEYENDDGDSSFGNDSASSTASVSASILEYRKIHGRTYQNFNTGTEYWGPNDERQNEALDINHHMLYLAFNDRLFLSPLTSPQRVLDVGTGTGIWAIDFADQHPSASVLGTDLSPIQPQWVPPNCKFELDDAQLSWTYPDNYFDFIHIRYLTGSIKDWDFLYREAFRCLKPGGWIEHYDSSIDVKSDDNSMPADCMWYQWSKLFIEAGEKMGRTFKIIDGGNNKKWISAAGFVKVQEVRQKMPIGGWAKEKKWKEIGEYNALITDLALEGYSLYLLTNIYEWSYAEIQVFLGKARQCLKDKSIHAYHEGAVVYGQKPKESG